MIPADRLIMKGIYAVVTVLTAVFTGCGPRYGSLTITTYPVTGTVLVDGEPCGDAPVSLTRLKTGIHEIAFSAYSDQYESPRTRKITVSSGETTTVSGFYRNRFLSGVYPDGFSPADSLRVFGTPERRHKDGTIFDYIDGGGLVYLDHGLRETTHLVLSDNGGTIITVDIFDMGTPENARAAFENESICPPDYISCPIGAPCKAYHYEPDFLMYFHTSEFLVYLNTSNDELRTALEGYAASIAEIITSKE